MHPKDLLAEEDDLMSKLPGHDVGGTGGGASQPDGAQDLNFELAKTQQQTPENDG